MTNENFCATLLITHQIKRSALGRVYHQAFSSNAQGKLRSVSTLRCEARESLLRPRALVARVKSQPVLDGHTVDVVRK